MRIIQDLGTVRVVSTGENPMHVSSDLVVERQQSGEWVRVRGFNTLSNDYAYTSANEYAQELLKKVA